MELEGGDLADYQGTQAGFELAIQDKYETTISRSWGEVARMLRTLYQVGQGEFVREPKAVEQPESVETEKKAGVVERQKNLTAEDVTDIRLESSSYSAVSREKEYHLSCKINGVPDTLVYTASQHDDGEGFTIRSGQREEDDIWKKMPQPELEKLEAVLAQAVEFDYWSKSIEHAADADALEVVTLDYQWAEDLNLSSEQRNALWEQIEDRKAQLTTQPAVPTEPMAAYPAEETHLPYDVAT